MNKNLKNKLNEKILNEIDKNNIKQRNRWYFILKNVLAWFSTIFMMLFAGHFLSGIYLIIKNHVIIPNYLFFILFVVLALVVSVTIFLAFNRFKRIKYSYRKSFSYVFVVGMVSLLLISFIFSSFNVYGLIDSRLSKSFPVFSIQKKVHDIWSHGEGGMLAGEVIGIDDDGLVFLKAFNGEIYLVDPVLLDDRDIDLFVENLNVRMFGFQDNDIFYPLKVYPWSFHGFNNFREKRYSRSLINENIDFYNE